MNYSVKQTAKEVFPHGILFILGVISLWRCYAIYANTKTGIDDEQAHILRIFIAFGAAAISIALPGFIEVGNKVFNQDDAKGRLSLNLKAGGALAIFVLVYLVEPI